MAVLKSRSENYEVSFTKQYHQFNILSIFFFIILTIIDEFYDMVEDFKVWFEEQDKLIADLTKKSRSTSTDRLSYGLEGSFRKLCVD